MRQLRSWLQRDVSPTMLGIFSAKQVYLWLFVLQATPTPSPYQLQAYGEILHCFKGFSMVSRVLHARPRLRLTCALMTVGSLALYVVGSLCNHLHPDVVQHTSERYTNPWAGGFLPEQRIFFCLVTLLLVLPELLVTTHLFLNMRAARQRTAQVTSATSIQDSVHENGTGSAPNDIGVPVTEVSTRNERRSSLHERCHLVLAILVILGSFCAAMKWVGATERGLAAANGAPWLSAQRSFLVAFSSSMATSVTTACDAHGVLTANTSADCLLSAADCGGGTQLLGLNLRGQGFQGHIPEMHNGTIPEHLRSLDLADNMLSGTLPTSIGRLSSLTQLRIYGNRLIGLLPSELADLHQLTDCLLTRNDQWVNYPDNHFDCMVPEDLPRVCGGSGGNVSVNPQLQCHPPFPPPPPSPPPSPPWY
jgi:hypothetical protein